LNSVHDEIFLFTQTLNWMLLTAHSADETLLSLTMNVFQFCFVFSFSTFTI